MPSPTAATSRRIAWLTLTTASVAMFSGSDSREARSVIERETIRISCERQTMVAIAQKKPIGRKRRRTKLSVLGEFSENPPLKASPETPMLMTSTAQSTETPIATG